jgi:hypothetical protein
VTSACVVPVSRPPPPIRIAERGRASPRAGRGSQRLTELGVPRMDGKDVLTGGVKLPLHSAVDVTITLMALLMVRARSFALVQRARGFTQAAIVKASFHDA